MLHMNSLNHKLTSNASSIYSKWLGRAKHLTALN